MPTPALNINIQQLMQKASQAFQSGQPATALKHLKKAAKITKNKDAIILNYLGLAYQGDKNFTLAEKAFKGALKINPKLAQAHYNLGLLEEGSSNIENAVGFYLKAFALEPKKDDLANKIGETYRKLGNINKALEYFAAANNLVPKNTLYINNMALCYVDQGNFSKAEHHYKHSLELGIEQTNVMVELANLLEDKDQAAALYKKALTISSITPTNIQDSPNTAFQLGRACEKLANYSTAFDFYDAAHNYWEKTLIIDNRHYKPGSVKEDLENVRQQFSNLAPNRDGYGNQSIKPIFIVGMPRTGTSLLEQILASHPSVFGAGELNLIPIIKKRIAAKSKGWISASVKLSKAEIEKQAGFYLTEIDQLSGDALFVVDKLPINFQNVGLIRLLFPNALIIHTRRNAMDTCLSIYLQNFQNEIAFNHKLENLAHCYRYQCDIMDFWKSWDRKIETVQYEKLLDNPKQLTLGLLEKLSLPWDDRCLRFYDTKRDVNTASHLQVRKPLYKSSVEKWRQYEKQLSPLATALGEYIQK